MKCNLAELLLVLLLQIDNCMRPTVSTNISSHPFLEYLDDEQLSSSLFVKVPFCFPAMGRS